MYGTHTPPAAKCMRSDEMPTAMTVSPRSEALARMPERMDGSFFSCLELDTRRRLFSRIRPESLLLGGDSPPFCPKQLKRFFLMKLPSIEEPPLNIVRRVPLPATVSFTLSVTIDITDERAKAHADKRPHGHGMAPVDARLTGPPSPDSPGLLCLAGMTVHGVTQASVSPSSAQRRDEHAPKRQRRLARHGALQGMCAVLRPSANGVASLCNLVELRRVPPMVVLVRRGGIAVAAPCRTRGDRDLSTQLVRWL